MSLDGDDFHEIEEQYIDAQAIVRDYLTHAPEQSDWEWEDHCDGLALGVLSALHKAGWRIILDPVQWMPPDNFPANNHQSNQEQTA